MTPEQETAELEAIGDFHDKATAEIKRLEADNEALRATLVAMYRVADNATRNSPALKAMFEALEMSA